MLGHKADLGFMALGPDLWRLRRLQTELAAAGLDVVDSYVSLTEMSEYAQGVPEEMKQARLYPQLPPEGKRAFCFYPMSKRREADAELVHAAVRRAQGADVRARRERAGRSPAACCRSSPARPASTTSSGASRCSRVHPDDLKEVVYTMRFDEASALYAEFGPFYTGMVGADRRGARASSASRVTGH